MSSHGGNLDMILVLLSLFELKISFVLEIHVAQFLHRICFEVWKLWIYVYFIRISMYCTLYLYDRKYTF